MAAKSEQAKANLRARARAYYANVRVMSMRANAMKNDATLQELSAFATWVLANPEVPQA